ncbi:hypothetical protein PGC08_14185 [Brevibacterium sp. BDJS002]|uniref:hypothetical protein n=1 Tax=Brevibacterium sp. BDJS002 TaxID=3020906 RepID=UPI00230798F7|nr:hypothetical protein [Brevibacterium sp. BDJS002]WCE39139.1 hypothetical protein PGC08_14185 [Brevibacterium sp. BDJS002]
MTNEQPVIYRGAGAPLLPRPVTNETAEWFVNTVLKGATMTNETELRDAEALGEAKRRDRADSDWHAREAMLLFVDAARWQREQLRTDGAVERLALHLIKDEGIDVSNGWPTNEYFGGGPAGDRDVEFKHAWMDSARAAITALLGEGA